MNPPTTLTNHNPPATIGCGLNPNPIRREESDTPQTASTGSLWRSRETPPHSSKKHAHPNNPAQHLT